MKNILALCLTLLLASCTTPFSPRLDSSLPPSSQNSPNTTPSVSTPTPDTTGSVLPSKAKAGPGCKIGGCSQTLCADETQEDVLTTCEWQESYVCYQSAECKIQSDGKCGWSNTSELTQCLSQKEPEGRL